MQICIEFNIYGVGYSADKTPGGFVWGNDRNEESANYHATLLEAQQDAIVWEAGRQDRIAQNEADAEADAHYRKEQRFQGYGA